MQTQYIYKWAGRFSRFILILLVVLSPQGWAQELDLNPVRQPDSSDGRSLWLQYEQKIRIKKRKDRINGISYIVSGTLALLGGLGGQGLTSDPLEKGVYTLFQTIGVASIGYGIYVWKLGDEDRWVYDSLDLTPSMPDKERAAVMSSYFRVKASREKEQKFVRAITHGLIAALNFYGATQQKNESVRNALIFLGGVNTLAVISYTF